MKRLLIIWAAVMLAGCASANPTPNVSIVPYGSVASPTAPAVQLTALPAQATSVPGSVATGQPATSVPAATLAPDQPATSVPAATPAPGKTFSDPNLGLSFVYPSNWEQLQRAADAPPGVTLHAPPIKEGPEPIIFALTVDVQPSDNKSVKQIVDEQLAQVPADLQAGIQRRTLTVGGEPGEEVIGLPSLSGAVETFVEHKGQVYLTILQPYDKNNSSLAPYLDGARAVYDAVLASYKFTK